MTYTSTRFTTTKRGNPCPICSDSTGACRESGNLTLCMWVADDVPGFKNLGRTKDGLWSKYVIDDGRDRNWTQQQKQDWQAQQRAIKDQRASAEKLAKANSLDLITRNREYRKLLNQLPLNSVDRADLTRRGLTDEQIKLGLYASVKKWQKFSSPINHQLAGVNLDGKSLNVFDAGYLIPVFDADGLIVACQIRLRQSEDGSRYRWLTSATKKRPNGASSHLPNGDLAIAVYQPATPQNNAIGMVEGYLKANITAQKLGQVMIGFGSHAQLVSSKETLKATLNQLNQKEILFYPDAESVANKSVLNSYSTFFNCATEWGYQVKVAWWGQFTKASPDIDELEDSSVISWISPDDFLAIGTEKSGWKPEEPEQTWKEKRAEQLAKLWQSRKVYTPDVTFQAEFLSLKLFPVPQPNTIVSMKSGMGSNKTGSMKQHISILKERDGCGFTLQGYRNQLLRQTVGRWGFEMLIDIEDDVEKAIRKQVKELGVSVGSTAQARMSDPNSMLAFCIDSHVKWQPHYFDGKVLILDEADAVIVHALTSGTLRETRKECLESFVESIQRASIIYCLSATLTDVVVDYIRDLRGDKTTKVIKYLNIFQKSVTINFVAGESRDVTDRDVIREMILDESEPCVVVADSQKELEAIEQSIRDRWATQGKRSPIILRIDSKTVETPEVKALLKDPVAAIERLKPDFILISPTANSGLDISLPERDLLQKLYAVRGRFKRMYGLYFGVIDVDSFAQLLFRLRDTTTERFISCPDQVILSDEDQRSQLPSEMVKNFVDLQTELALLAFTGTDKADLLEGFFEKIRAQTGDRHFQELNQIQAARNHERSHLKECLIERLTSLGHECATQVKVASTDASEAIAEAKEVIEVQASKAILEADDISLKIAMVYRSTSVRYEKTLQAEKAFLKDRLKGIEDTELWRADLIKFVRFDDRRFTKQVELRYLFNNPETAQLKAQDALERIGFLPDIKADLMCVTALKDIGIERLIQYQGDDLHNDHQLIVDICQKAGTKKNKVRLSKSQGKQTNLQFIGRLLQMIGYGAIKSSQQKKEQTRTRTYKIVDSHQMDFNDRFGESSFDIFYGCIETKFENYLNSRKEADFLAKNLPEKLDQNVTSKIVENYTEYGLDWEHLQDTCLKNKMLKVFPDFTWLDQPISPVEVAQTLETIEAIEQAESELPPPTFPQHITLSSIEQAKSENPPAKPANLKAKQSVIWRGALFTIKIIGTTYSKLTYDWRGRTIETECFNLSELVPA